LDAKAAELVEQVFANCQLFNNPARNPHFQFSTTRSKYNQKNQPHDSAITELTGSWGDI